MVGVRRTPGSTTRLVIGRADDAALGGLRWLSPTLVGLTAPILAALIFFPAVLRDAASAIVIVLLFAMFLAVAAYVTTVFIKGPIVGLIVDSARHQVLLVQDGPFATTVTELATDEIADFRRRKRYDDDGYSQSFVELVFRDGEKLPLQLDMTEAQYLSGRSMMGFVAA
ncbi:MAG: hypothetical protein KDJ36_02125 [Hyphomicrobiaceae bacterium]|nr:hypothetical protein [Hyphomicrobiaceae bacterium]